MSILPIFAAFLVIFAQKTAKKEKYVDIAYPVHYNKHIIV